MTSHQLDEERIFHFARELPNLEAQAEYLAQACAGDQALRERVEELLRVHEQEQSFLKSNGEPAPTEPFKELQVAAGQTIGRYKLLQRIGEGGFGVVFMAEQTRPVRRKVALKVIKPGMDSQAVVARFEAERQALAMMDHPNIARVIDGGATDGGRPYFVMELVKGVPITEYCDKNELATEQRLKLFTTVCQAVQHAHQKGIIHRDLKPSNVLVTLADGEPVVKVIDFGVAKATNQQLTEKTLFTAFGQMVGTPQYMSPEQAEMSCLDVDTRSDVYSLGVLLYELLTGTTPLEAERLRTAGYAEMQRLIREEEPPKPSTRLSTSGDKLTILAKHRKVTPEKLKSQVKGDLDWIVMKALEKDRNRRYESPNELASDVSNYLTNEPIKARSPTLGYRTRKYLQRNRLPVTVTAVIVLALTLGLAGTVSQWLEARRQSNIAREEIYNRLILDILVDPASSAEGLKRASKLDLDASKDALLRALIAFYKEDFTSAREHLGQAEDGIVKQSIVTWISATADDEPEFLAAAQRLNELKPRNDIEALLKAQLYCIARPEQAIKILDEREAAQQTGILGNVIRSAAVAHSPLRFSDPAESERAVRQIQAAYTLRPNSPFIASVALSTMHVARSDAKLRGDSDEAQRYLREAEAIAESIQANAGNTWSRVGLLVVKGSADEALKIFERKFAKGISGSTPVQYAPLAVANGDVKRAIEKLEAFPKGVGGSVPCYVQIGLAQLYAVSGDSSGAHKIVDGIREQYKSCDARMYMLYSYALAPDATADEVVARAVKLLEGSEEAVIPYRAHLEFWADGGTDRQRLLRKSPGKGHFEVALSATLNGQPEEARRHFEKQLKLGMADAQDFWAMYYLNHVLKSR